MCQQDRSNRTYYDWDGQPYIKKCVPDNCIENGSRKDEEQDEAKNGTPADVLLHFGSSFRIDSTYPILTALAGTFIMQYACGLSIQ